VVRASGRNRRAETKQIVGGGGGREKLSPGVILCSPLHSSKQ
jgi:hypothetical protein